MPMRSLIPGSWASPWLRSGAVQPQRDPFGALHQEMNRLFDSFGHFGEGRWPQELSPRLDVSESDTGIDIEVELPGLDEKDVDVTLSGDVLTIRGERKNGQEEKTKNYHLTERSYGSFTRSVSLPFDVDPKKATATFDKGVLHITLPKPENVTAKTAKIPVKAA